MDSEPRVKTILHVIDTTGPGGAETIFTQLVAESASRGFKALALIRGKGWVSSELERLGAQYFVENCKGSFNFRFLRRLIRFIKDYQVDLVQSHLFGSNIYTCLAGLICRVPVITTFHGFVDISKRERLLAAKFSIISLGAVKIIAVTNQIGAMLSQHLGARSRKVVVIANGVDTNVFVAATRRLPKGRVTIGTLGNVRPAKNYPLAIRVIAQMVSLGYDVQLSVAGDDKNQLADHCKSLAAQLGISDKIQWLGFCADVPNYLNSLDIFLLSSSSEGHPLALTQAMSMGLPIVVTRCGAENLVEDGVSALVADNECEDHVVSKLKYLIDNCDVAVKLGVAARAQCVQRWSLENTYEAYMELYTTHGK